MKRRKLLAQISGVGVTYSLAGCSTWVSADEPTTEGKTVLENNETATDQTSTPTPTPHPRYAECPEGTTRENAEGPPLTIEEMSSEIYFYDGGRGDPPTEFVRSRCVDAYSERFKEEVIDRVGVRFDQMIDDRSSGGKTVLAAFLVFDFRTEDESLRGVPPVRFNEYQEVVPKALSAEVTINGEPRDCEVPVEVGCLALYLD